MAEQKKTLSEYEQEIVKLLKAEFKSKRDFSKKNPRFYFKLYHNQRGLLCEALPNLGKTWTLEECLADAKKYSFRREWQDKSRAAYGAATRNNWLDDCCKHMEVKLKKWTLEECLVDAKKYSHRGEWSSKSPRPYACARRNGWLNQCCKHMEAKHKTHTFESCLADAKKYDFRHEWESNSPKFYSAARRNGWFDQCCKHMGSNHSKSVKCLETQKVYKSIKEAIKMTGISTIRAYLRGKVKTAGGYHWTYCEKE